MTHIDLQLQTYHFHRSLELQLRQHFMRRAENKSMYGRLIPVWSKHKVAD